MRIVAFWLATIPASNLSLAGPLPARPLFAISTMRKLEPLLSTNRHPFLLKLTPFFFTSPRVSVPEGTNTIFTPVQVTVLLDQSTLPGGSVMSTTGAARSLPSGFKSVDVDLW